MSERTLIVDHLKFSYDGLFNASELYQLIGGFFFEKNWDYKEKMNQEVITPSGKQVFIELEPWKSSTDYYKLITKIRMIMTDLKDVEVEHEGKTLKLNQGLVRITFDGYVLSDRWDRWTTQPFTWFLSIIFEKYLFRSHFRKLETWLKSDLDDLLNRIKTFLNTYKYTYKM